MGTYPSSKWSSPFYHFVVSLHFAAFLLVDFSFLFFWGKNKVKCSQHKWDGTCKWCKLAEKKKKVQISSSPMNSSLRIVAFLLLHYIVTSCDINKTSSAKCNIHALRPTLFIHFLLCFPLLLSVVCWPRKSAPFMCRRHFLSGRSMLLFCEFSICTKWNCRKCPSETNSFHCFILMQSNFAFLFFLVYVIHEPFVYWPMYFDGTLCLRFHYFSKSENEGEWVEK